MGSLVLVVTAVTQSMAARRDWINNQGSGPAKK